MYLSGCRRGVKLVREKLVRLAGERFEQSVQHVFLRVADLTLVVANRRWSYPQPLGEFLLSKPRTLTKLLDTFTYSHCYLLYIASLSPYRRISLSRPLFLSIKILRSLM